MTGWRDFAIERDKETETWLIATSLKEEKEMNVRKTEDYIVIHIFGYPPLGDNDKELNGLLRKRRLRGYYVSANDTTDTAGGWIRPQRGGMLRRLNPYCFEKEIEILQLKCVARWDAYDVLLEEGFPVFNRYGEELRDTSDE